jgi:hypothetical protein
MRRRNALNLTQGQRVAESQGLRAASRQPGGWRLRWCKYRPAH